VCVRVGVSLVVSLSIPSWNLFPVIWLFTCGECNPYKTTVIYSLWCLCGTVWRCVVPTIVIYHNTVHNMLSNASTVSFPCPPLLPFVTSDAFECSLFRHLSPLAGLGSCLHNHSDDWLPADVRHGSTPPAPPPISSHPSPNCDTNPYLYSNIYS